MHLCLQVCRIPLRSPCGNRRKLSLFRTWLKAQEPMLRDRIPMRALFCSRKRASQPALKRTCLRWSMRRLSSTYRRIDMLAAYPVFSMNKSSKRISMPTMASCLNWSARPASMPATPLSWHTSTRSRVRRRGAHIILRECNSKRQRCQPFKLHSSNKT